MANEVTTDTNIDLFPNVDFFSFVFGDLDWTDFVGLGSALLILCVFFNLAINASKLHKHHNHPGTNILRMSCWVLATAWIPLTALTFFLRDDDLFYVVLTLITTGAMITGAFGFRKLVAHLSTK